jgi:GTP-binding protein
MADLPGLIEGAHAGVGLGHEFLRHVERTRVLVHVVDMSGMEGRDPFDDWVKINEELALYNERLSRRPQIVAANKMDMPDAQPNLERFREQVRQVRPEIDVVPVSTLTRMGVSELIRRVADLLDSAPDPLAAPEPSERPDEGEGVVYRLKPQEGRDFTIRRDNETFVVESEAIEKLMKRTQFTSYDAVMRFARILRKMGVDQALRERGAKDGSTIRIGDFEFEFFEGGADEYLFDDT